MMMPQGGQGGMPQLPGNVGIALDEYGRPFLVMRDQVMLKISRKEIFQKLKNRKKI